MNPDHPSDEQIARNKALDFSAVYRQWFGYGLTDFQFERLHHTILSALEARAAAPAADSKDETPTAPGQPTEEISKTQRI